MLKLATTVWPGSTRRASTTVELRDGESFAIAGLLQDDFRNLKGAVPWLGDIPILGNLFKKKGRLKEKAELLIFVTPKVLRVSQR